MQASCVMECLFIHHHLIKQLFIFGFHKLSYNLLSVFTDRSSDNSIILFDLNFI